MPSPTGGASTRQPDAGGTVAGSPTAGTVLVVDDEPMVREVVTRYLQLDGFRVHEAADGAAARRWLAERRPDLVVLDIMLPGTDGLSIFRELRAAGDVPVILLTARAEEVDRVLGLELGADDYVVKPFSTRELVARVRSVLRRSAPKPASDGDAVLDFGRLRIELLSREVTVDGRRIELTPKEFDLLAVLARSPRQVFSRRQLLAQVWDSAPEYQDSATVTVHVGRLRQKLEKDPENPRWITTSWGVGYRFEAQAAPVIALSWWDAITDQPVEATLALGGLAAGTIAAAFALRRLNRRSRSLRRQVLATTLAALAIGALAAVLLARLMILDSAELARVAAVLGVTALLATVLVLFASVPLGRDVRQLETTVRRIEDGDRAVRTGVARSDELGHVAKALDELTARLDSLERERAGYEAERNAMLSSVGHDLRTPLAALRVAVDALADGVAPDPDRYLRSMRRDVEALAALVDDFFLLARIESGRLDLHPVPVDLTEVADEAVEALAPVAAATGVTLALDASTRVHVRGNPTALGRVVRNLIDNAIRHAPPGSVVRVAVAADGRPSIRVVDEGPGFPPGFGDEAFARFTRADASRNRATGGAGLGLAIARGLVEAHGGRIWIEAPPGGRVAFELPAA